MCASIEASTDREVDMMNGGGVTVNPLSGNQVCSGVECMGGRLPAVAGMPANRTFLELSAGQFDWPKKKCVVLSPKKRRRPVSFRHEEKRFFLWMAPCLSIKSGVYQVTYSIFRLPSLIIL